MTRSPASLRTDSGSSGAPATGIGRITLRKATAAPPRRGRPLLVPPERVLERIRALSRSRSGLFKVHRKQPRLYARARRMFGTWEAAVSAAGLDYRVALDRARLQSAQSRRRARRRLRRRVD